MFHCVEVEQRHLDELDKVLQWDDPCCWVLNSICRTPSVCCRCLQAWFAAVCALPRVPQYLSDVLWASVHGPASVCFASNDLWLSLDPALVSRGCLVCTPREWKVPRSFYSSLPLQPMISVWVWKPSPGGGTASEIELCSWVLQRIKPRLGLGLKSISFALLLSGSCPAGLTVYWLILGAFLSKSFTRTLISISALGFLTEALLHTHIVSRLA